MGEIMRRPTQFRLTSAVLALALVTTACGGEDPETEADPVEPTEEAEESPEEEPETDPADGSEGTAEEEPEAAGAGGDLPEGYPEGSIDMIIPFTAGGPADASGRAFNQYAQELTGTTFSAVNIEGAGGVTGWAQFVESEPDGYTLTIATPPFNIIPAVMNPEQTPYTLDQFQYICTFANVPNGIYIRSDDERFETLEDVIQFATENPGALTVGMTGAAGTDMVHMRILEGEAGVEFTPVPFDGGADAAQALAGGQVDLMVSDVTWAELQEEALTMIAVAAEERHEKYPDTPTYQEAGYDVVGARLRTVAAPPGTDESIINYWSDVCQQLTENPEFVEDMEALGQPVGYLDPQGTRELVDDMTADIEFVVEEYGMGAE